MGDLMEPDVKKAISDLESLKALAEGGDRVEAADIGAVINILNPPKPPLPEEPDHDHKGHWKAEDTEIYVLVDDIAYPAQEAWAYDKIERERLYSELTPLPFYVPGDYRIWGKIKFTSGPPRLTDDSGRAIKFYLTAGEAVFGSCRATGLRSTAGKDGFWMMIDFVAASAQNFGWTPEEIKREFYVGT